MNGQLALFMLMFDGKLSVDEKFVPTYTGGKNRLLQVSINTKLDPLKLRVLKALKIDSSRYTVNIVCRFPVGNDLIATHVDDDKVCDIVISHAIGICLILYVEVEEKSLENGKDENLTFQFRESLSLDDEVEMHGGGPMHFVEEYFNVRDGQNQCGPNVQNSSTQPSCANMSGVTGCRVTMPVVDEGYEAMDSGSGKEHCDVADELTPNRNEASLSKTSLNNKVGQSSSLNPSRRSRSPQSVESQRTQTSPKRAICASQEKHPGSESEEGPFDICNPANEGPVKLKKSLLALKREKRKELECPTEQYLRPGMVLLKKFLGHMDQDRDESEESLRKRLPIVSFSIGDSAEFLYCDVRDVDKAEKVMLESGDVLISGGDARHIFNGVSCIKPNTATKIPA